MTTLSGKYIKTARLKMGLTQVELAKKLGVCQVQICHYETGRSMASMELGLKLMALEKKFDKAKFNER